jgi:DNA-binding NarL/FixJ family response regulator
VPEEDNLLVQSIRKVAADGRWVEKVATTRAMEQLLDREENLQRTHGLFTRRETEIVELVAEGRSNREIAGKLFISETTVKTHLHAIFEKAGVKSRMQVVAFAKETGLI